MSGGNDGVSGGSDAAGEVGSGAIAGRGDSGGRVLVVIPARGGSKGIPRKNLAPLGGLPLLAHTAKVARTTPGIDRVVLSTDDAEIAEVGRALGLDVPFLRPAELARDDTPGVAPVLHALDALLAAGDAYRYVVLLQPTSPLRAVEDVTACLDRCRGGAPASVSVSAVEKSPWWTFRLGADGRLVPLLDPATRPTRRQDSPPLVALNGAVYVADVAWLRRTGTFVADETEAVLMPRERAIDVDDAFDLLVADALLRARA